MERDSASLQPLFHALIAEQITDDAVKPIGFACFHPGFSTMAGKTLFIMDFYVRTAYRRQGVGQQLFLELVRLAKQWNCRRIDFHVNVKNDVAARFYEKIGALNCSKSGGWEIFEIDFADDVERA